MIKAEPNMLVGAGTALNVEQAEKAVTYIKEHMLEKGKALDYKES